MKVLKPSIWSLALTVIIGSLSQCAHAVETSSAAPDSRMPVVQKLICDGLPYVEGGVAMVPARQVCDFLGAKLTFHDGLLTVVKSFDEPDTSIARTISMRLGGKSAQIWDGGSSRTVALPKATESRLGTVFVPAKFLVEILGGELHADKSFKPLAIKEGDRVGSFSSNYDPPYTRSDAAQVTISNRVGRAISLRLSGPQKLRVEIPHNDKISLRIKPGMYYYQAGSAGMQTIKSVRRLIAGRRINWAWGKN